MSYIAVKINYTPENSAWHIVGAYYIIMDEERK